MPAGGPGRRARGRRGEQGAAAAEFAIVLLPLLLVLFATIEFGVALYDKAMITNASREAARFGTLFAPVRPTAAEIRQRVLDVCAGTLVTFGAGGAPTVTVTGAGGEPGEMLAVQVDYTYGYLVLPNFVATLAPLQLRAVTTMRLE